MGSKKMKRSCDKLAQASWRGRAADEWGFRGWRFVCEVPN